MLWRVFDWCRPFISNFLFGSPEVKPVITNSIVKLGISTLVVFLSPLLDRRTLCDDGRGFDSLETHIIMAGDV